MTRARAALVGLAIAALACAGTRARSAETEAELARFYEAWEAEVRDAVRDLDPGERRQLEDIWPRAEFEGATRDVIAVIASNPSLRPTARRLERFLRDEPSNRVRVELATETVDLRLWHILVDTVNAELGRP